ncbi:MAG: T9SS type A sorting domain-containing protein [Candidatus Eisenbacteria bacterium]
MSLVRTRITVGALALAAVTLAMSVNSVRPAAAQQNQDLNEVVRIQGQVLADRMALLREEFKERQHEIREARERAALKGKKNTRGKKAEPAINDDYYAGSQSGLGKGGFPSIDVAPTNSKANDKTGDGATAGQAEQSIAFLGLNGLAAWNDGQGFNVPPDVQGYGYTINGGATWTDGGVPLKQGTITSWSSDPVVTVNEKTGDFYYNGLTGNSGVNNNGVGVARGHFQAGTFVWDASTMVAAGPSSTQGFDKQWIAADSLNGNLYVSWTLFTTTGSSIFFARSTDNGATWSAPMLMNGAWENGLVSGSRPLVGPNGEVYVIYSAIGPVDADSIKIAKSTNNGVTFSPSVVAMTVFDNYFTGAPGFNRPRAVTFPGAAVDRSTGPNRGRVYATIQDCVNFYGDPLGGGTSKSEVESNSGFANATPFTVGQTLRGTLTSTADTDNWKFPATAGTTYIFFVDSLKTSGFRYTMRIYCPNDTLAVSRLAFSGAQSTTSAVNSHSLIVWTAPTSNTYYLRMTPVTTSSTNSNYRIQSGTHTASASDIARDARDVTAASSADGVTGWSTRTVVNNEPALYDNWLPEVAVSCEGNPYIMWFDWRDAAPSCFGGSNIYLTRSTNAGASWAPSQVATTAPTPNWTQVISNIAPNQGDYNGMYGGDCIALAFADGRLGDADVFTARLTTEQTLSDCPGNQVILAGSTLSGNVTVTNNNQMFDNTYAYAMSANVAWPSFPTAGNTFAAASGSGSVPYSITVPDTAADGEVVHVCISVSIAGACVHTCCFDLTVSNPATPTLMSLFDAETSGGDGVTLTWASTATRSIREWNVYRGSRPDVILDRVNAQPIPMGSGGGFSVHDAASLSGTVYYRLTAVLTSGAEVDQAVTSVQVNGTTPRAFAFALAGSNPFRGRTNVSLSLPESAPVRITVYNVAGQRIRTLFSGPANAGTYTLPLEIEHAGVYIVSVEAGKYSKNLRVTALP